jgi:hypothetical protein
MTPIDPIEDRRSTTSTREPIGASWRRLPRLTRSRQLHPASDSHSASSTFLRGCVGSDSGAASRNGPVSPYLPGRSSSCEVWGFCCGSSDTLLSFSVEVSPTVLSFSVEVSLYPSAHDRDRRKQRRCPHPWGWEMSGGRNQQFDRSASPQNGAGAPPNRRGGPSQGHGVDAAGRGEVDERSSRTPLPRGAEQ